MEIKTYLDAIDIFQKIYEGSRFKAFPHFAYSKFLTSKTKTELPDRVLGYPIDFIYMPSYQDTIWTPDPDGNRYYDGREYTHVPEKVESINPIFNYDVYVEFWSLFKAVESEDIRKYFVIKSVEWDRIGGGKINYQNKEVQKVWSAQGFIVCFESSVKEAIKSLGTRA